MEPTVIFRDFEERDIDFIYRCKNDEKLNSTIVGQFRPFSHEDAEKWVHGCMGEHETYKFWAIATNDEEQRIVGWVSLSNIDNMNKSACFHGIVIGDADYRDGFAWVETYRFVLEYVFERLNLHRMCGSHLVSHKQSDAIAHALFIRNEGIQKEAIFKNAKYEDLSIDAILADEYFAHKEAGDYEFKKIVKRLINNLK